MYVKWRLLTSEEIIFVCFLTSRLHLYAIFHEFLVKSKLTVIKYAELFHFICLVGLDIDA